MMDPNANNVRVTLTAPQITKLLDSEPEVAIELRDKAANLVAEHMLRKAKNLVAKDLEEAVKKAVMSKMWDNYNGRLSNNVVSIAAELLLEKARPQLNDAVVARTSSIMDTPRIAEMFETEARRAVKKIVDEEVKGQIRQIVAEALGRKPA